jgi:hypothetical protein
MVIKQRTTMRTFGRKMCTGNSVSRMKSPRLSASCSCCRACPCSGAGHRRRRGNCCCRRGEELAAGTDAGRHHSAADGSWGTGHGRAAATAAAAGSAAGVRFDSDCGSGAPESKDAGKRPSVMLRRKDCCSDE